MNYKEISLRKGRKGIIKSGHPWIYKNQILKINPSVKPGGIIFVKTSEGKVIGTGYYNPRSEISIRLLSFKEETIDKDFFDNKIRAAFAKRKDLLSKTNAYRAVFSEADGLPGLIVDVYDDTAVFQILTLGMENFKKIIAVGIKEVLRPKYLYEKSSSPFRKLEGLKDVQQWWDPEGKTIVEISEGSARFLVDIEKGHKTGFYLDQRNSRLAMSDISSGKKVLDLFCYTGGFSVSACLDGAESAVGVDVKEEWLEMARKNAALNGAAGKTKFAKSDAFDFLKEAGRCGSVFDIIILDPPSFIKTRSSIIMASKGYRELNAAAMRLLSDGGILATFSCSHNMPNEIFSQILKEAAIGANKKITVLKRCHQASDHPIVKQIPETEYLKGYFLRAENLPIT